MMLLDAQTISESTSISGSAFWAFAGAAVAISFWIQRTIQGVRDELTSMSKEFGLRMQAIELKMDGNMRRSEFQAWVSELRAKNSDIAVPEAKP